jgi:hypothetical protein
MDYLPRTECPVLVDAVDPDVHPKRGDANIQPSQLADGL